VLKGFGDKFEGFKEEMKGKVTRNPDLVQHGHDMRTGVLKQKELEDVGGFFSIPIH
jgi:hypothetical protein